MKIASRLMLGATVLTALAVVGSAGTTGWLALNHSSQAVEAALQRQFQTTAAGREEALLRQFESFGELLQSQAHSRMTQEALYGFVRPFDSYRYEVPATINIAELREQLGHWYQDEYIPFHRRNGEYRNERTPDWQGWLDNMAHDALLLTDQPRWTGCFASDGRSSRQHHLFPAAPQVPRQLSRSGGAFRF